MKEKVEDTLNRFDEKHENLQHRLEQLVAVHRQLLRKYGSLELENTEMRKKLEIIILKDKINLFL